MEALQLPKITIMRFGVAVKEKIARAIAEHFTTNEIVNVFADANIPTDRSLYAKWRITLDAFNKMSEPEASIPHILEVFCHPLNFEDPQARGELTIKLNTILAYENLEIKITDRTASVVPTDGTSIPSSQNRSGTKTPIDYVIEAINFFKNEYNKVRTSGLTYDYSIGENINSDQVEGGREEYDEKLKAIEQLKEIGFITEYKVEEKVECDGYYVWDYAVCKIDESKITQKEAPRATDEAVENLTQKIIHEHTHHFENSIQEKDIALHHKFGDHKKRSGSYITKEDDDFSYKGRYLNISKKSDYYKVFCARLIVY